MADMNLRMTGEAQAVIQQLGQVRRAQETLEQKLRDFGTTSQKVGQEERELNRMREQVLRQIQTPQEQYNQKVGQLDRLLKANKLSQDQYNRAVAQSKQEMDRAGESGQKAFGPMALGMTRQLIGALGITGGVAGAIQVVRMEYQQLIETQREAGLMNMTVAEAQETALMNLGATSVRERDKFLGAVQTMASDLRVSEAEVYRRATPALSARGAKPVYGPGSVMDAVEASFGFARGDSSAGIAAAGAALDISAVTGATAEQSLGFLQTVGKQARVEDPREQAVNLPPAMKAAMDTGATPQEAGALFAAFTQGMTDPTGRRSGTSAISFVVQLRDRFEKELDDAAKLFAEGKMSPERYKAIQGKAAEWENLGLTARITELQNDPVARDVFLKNTSWERKAQIPVEQLLAGGATFQDYASFRDELPPVAQASGLFRARESVRRGAGPQRIEDFRRELQGIRERAGSGNEDASTKSAIRDEFWPTLSSAGVGWAAQTNIRLGMGWDPGPSEYARVAGDFAESRRMAAQRGEPGAQRQMEILQELAESLSRSAAAQERAADRQERAAGHLERAVRGGETLAPPNPQGDR